MICRWSSVKLGHQGLCGGQEPSSPAQAGGRAEVAGQVRPYDAVHHPGLGGAQHHGCPLAAPRDLLQTSPPSLSRNPTWSSYTIKLSCNKGAALLQWPSQGHWAASWWSMSGMWPKPSGSPTSSPTGPRATWWLASNGGAVHRDGIWKVMHLEVRGPVERCLYASVLTSRVSLCSPFTLWRCNVQNKW